MGLKMKKIGVVVPVYNAKKYLCQCVDSILNQKYSNFEVVLVDDGSTDGSGELCDTYSSDRRVSVIHQKNQGMLKARYNGIKYLSCDYITTIDSDDWISPETFEVMSSHIQFGYDIIAFNIVRYFSEWKQEKRGEKYRGLYNKDRISSDIFPTMIWDVSNESYGLDPSLCNKLFKKELFEKYLKKASNLEVDYGQDAVVLYPLMSEAKSIFFMPDYFYFHRQRQLGEVAGYIRDSFFGEKTLKAYRYLNEFYGGDAVLEKQIDFFLANSFEQRLMILYGEKTVHQNFLFPYHKVEKGSRIILYGAGKVGQSYLKQLNNTNYCNVQAIIDKKCKNINGISVFAPEAIPTIVFDYIVISVASFEIVREIIENLCAVGIKKERIIWGFDNEIIKREL